jgi:two-component system alkaline phosphatase synthesis response regulator PhoP
MQNLKGHTILLVDDEPDILEFLSYNIRKEGYKVFTANNGEEAVRLTQQLNPSLSFRCNDAKNGWYRNLPSNT